MGCMDSSGSKSRSTTQSYLPSQEANLNKALKVYMPYIGKSWSYPGQRVADFSGLQNTVLDNAGNYMDIYSTPSSSGNPLMSQTGQSLASLLTGQAGAQKITDQQADDYFTQRIQDPTIRTLKEDILPGVDASYAGTDFFSSGRAKSRNQAMQDTSDALTQQRAQLMWDVNQANQSLDEADAQRMQQAVNQGMDYSMLPAQQALADLSINAQQIEGLQNLFNLGATEQNLSQEQINAEIQKFMEDNRITDPETMSVILALLGMNYNSSYTKQDQWGDQLGYLWTSPQGIGKSVTGLF